MNLSAPFIRRPVATMLLAVGLMLCGFAAMRFLPIAALPGIDFPVIVVTANRPGASPEAMASSVAAPLERRLGEIPGVNEMTSTSNLGNTSIVINFEIDRDVDSAAKDVQAAINAASSDLPSDLPSRPNYRKFNPAAAPVLTLGMWSDQHDLAAVFDAADTVVAQRLSQVEGVAAVSVDGAATPAVRVRLNPGALRAAGLSSQDVYAAIRAANVNGPTGSQQGPERAEAVLLNGQITEAADYGRLVLKSVDGAVVRLSDVAEVVDGVANSRVAAAQGTKPAIILTVTKTAEANVIETVDRVKALLPQVQSWIAPDIHLDELTDRTGTIRASVQEVEYSLLASIALVLLVMLLFMRRLVPTIAAAVTIPLSLAGTLAAMWLLGFSLNNFSLMALTIAVGFVVDDAIVMIENVFRHQERGAGPFEAALAGAKQIGFTVISISISLIAVFIPILFMGGVLGKLFHEFATVLAVAISMSAVVSLTLTPMILGRWGGDPAPLAGRLGRVDRAVERALARLTAAYARSLAAALRWQWAMLLLTLLTIVLTVQLYRLVPKGFLPTQDTGLLQGATNGSQDISFAAMAERQARVVDIILADPAVANVASTVGVSGGWSSPNRGRLTIGLKPYAERGMSSEEVLNRLRPKVAPYAGVQTQLWSAQDLRGGGGGSGGTGFSFVLLGEDVGLLRDWTLKLADALRAVPGIVDINSDQDKPGPEIKVVVNREAASRLDVPVTAIDAAIANAFSQRQVSVIYTPRNQYRVVLETLPDLQTDPADFDRLFVVSSTGQQVPISTLVRLEMGTAPLAVRHQGGFPSASISFDRLPGTSQGDAIKLVENAARELRLPEGIRTTFGGNAAWLQQSLSSQPILLAAALLAIYIVLGILYESLIHPLTILSSLPSAGLGALLAVLGTGGELGVLGVIGILLLMGIVKKNAIMIVDFALEAERERGLDPVTAIRDASVERFRPILMTTLAALLGALPLALATGVGSEFRQPLGVVIVGGLVVSQLLTLYTTPAVYLALERLASRRRRRAPIPVAAALPAE